MTSEAQVKQLVLDVFESGRTPEEVCAQYPELLQEVQKRLDRMQRADQEFEKLFPTDDAFDGQALPGGDAKLPCIQGYEVQGILGQGGMGIVYRARHVATDRLVAIKMLRFRDFAGTSELDRFSQEYRLLASLNHPRIVQVYDVGMSAGHPYFTMELVQGATLEAVLKQGPQKCTYAAAIVEKLCQAIDAAHQQGIVHRDLKPSNILLTAELEPKVTDFGLARYTQGGPGLTLTGVGVGTPSYMAPEQAAGRNREIGLSVDVYALGAILYQLLTGRVPFRGESDADTILQVITLEPVPPSRLNSKVPRDLETICLKCLEKVPGSRYPSARDLGKSLGLFLDGKPIPDRPVGRFERTWRWCRRNPPLASTIALSTLLVVTLVVVSIVFGIQQGRISERLRTTLQESQKQKTFSTWDYGRQLCESGEIGHGLLLLARTIESLPEDENELRIALETEVAAWHSRCHTLQKVFAHPSKVLAMAVSQDGQFCVTGSSDGSIQIGHLNSGEQRRVAQETGEVQSIALTPDGKTILTAASHSDVNLWSTETGAKIGVLQGHRQAVTSVAVSSDHRFALTGSLDKTARLWRLPSRECQAEFIHEGPILTVAFSSDSQKFFTGGRREEGGAFRVYRTDQAGSEAPVFQGTKKKRVISGAFSSEGKTLAIGDGDWETSFWDLVTQKQIAILNSSHGKVNGIAFRPVPPTDGASAGDIRPISHEKQLVLLGIEESRRGILWDVATLRSRWSKRQEDTQDEGAMQLSDQDSLKPVFPTVPHTHPVTAVAFVPPEGDRFLTASTDGYVRLWKTAPGFQAGKLLHDPDQEVVLRSTAINSSASLVATAGDDGKVVVWNSRDGKRIRPSLDCSAAIKSIEFTPDGSQLIVGCKDGWIRFWDTETWKELESPILLANGISGFCLYRGGRALLLTTNGIAQSWMLHPFEKSTLVLEHSPENPKISLNTVAGPNDEFFLTTGEDSRAVLWDKVGAPIAELKHQNEVREGVFSPDGEWVITGSNDHKVRIWKTSDGSLVATLTHQSEVFSIASASDNQIVTGSRDGAQIWNVLFQRRIGPACWTGEDVMSVRCSFDGKTAILGDWSGTGMIWSLPRPMKLESRSLLKLIQSDVSMKLDAGGGQEVLTGEEWQQLNSTE